LNFYNCKNSKFRLTTFTSLDPKRNIVNPQFYGTTANSPVRCAFWGPNECGPSAPRCSFYLTLGSSSFSCNDSAPNQCCAIFPTFSFSVHLDATSILKHLRYSRGVGQIQIRTRYFECRIQRKNVLKWVWQGRYIRGLVNGSHFVLQSSASF